MKEFIVNKERKSNRKLLLYALFSMIMVFIGIQMYVLTTVGVQGEKINQIKQEQNRLRIENELKQAEVQTLQSRKEVLESIDELGMKETEVNLVTTDTRTAASNNE